jgi:hypothetical protein
MKRLCRLYAALLLFFGATQCASAGVGNPQVRTDHPWYPGELACSTFERLFATQAEVYERVVGRKPVTDQDRALAAWLWRNTHYWHGEEGAEDLWGKGLGKGPDIRLREYWTGLYANGFGLCGTTHGQWVAEMEALFGHGRGRAVGVSGHNSFEVFLTGGPYGEGKWVLLDHDISTVIFNKDGTALLSLAEVQKNWKQLTQRSFAPGRQHGWLVCGLHPDDGGSYSQYTVAEYLAGYSGPPPMVHLRRGESLRRYFKPGLEHGKTFVFWGRNYNAGGIPGPERSHTWVNQPEKMYQSRTGTGYHPGQARYANAVYTYQPDFTTDAYKDGVIEEKDGHITFEFYTPYIIAATPPNQKPWGIYDAGCKNGLVLRGQVRGQVELSTDQGLTWHDCGPFKHEMDLTDFVKGRRQYFLRFHATRESLRIADLTITTVCQVNSSVLPRLKDGGTRVTFQASGQAVVSAGPNLPQAQAHVGDGKLGSPRLTLALASPRGEPVTAVYAAAHVHSSNPPRPEIKYQIEYSTDGGKSWMPMIKDWTINRRGDEPRDFWSQSLCWGSVQLQKTNVARVLARFRNDGGKSYARCELHLVYRLPRQDGTLVTFSWTDDKGPHTAEHFIPGGEARRKQATTWTIPTGQNVQTHWVEFTPKVGL